EVEVERFIIEQSSGCAFTFLDALSHFFNVTGNIIEIGDGGLRSVDNVTHALLSEAIDVPAILDRLTVKGAWSDVNHVIAEHARALEHGKRVGANALNRRTSVELAVNLHDDLHIVLRLRIRRNVLEVNVL